MTAMPLLEWTPPEPYPAGGSTFDEARDGARLNAQCKRVHDATVNKGWTTLREISAVTGDPEASISARLRDLRAFGFKVEREYVERGLWRYRVTKE